MVFSRSPQFLEFISMKGGSIKRIFFGGIALISTLSMIVVLLWSRSFTEGHSGSFLEETYLDGKPELVAYCGGAWVWAEDRRLRRRTGVGEQESILLPAGVTALKADAETGYVYAADRMGVVHVFDSEFHPLYRIPLSGAIMDLALLDDGRMGVCYGMSAYGSDYFLSVIGPGEERLDSSGMPLGFATRLLATDGKSFYYATVNARLGRISLAGEQIWERILFQKPVSMAASKGGIVAAGDRRGGLVVYDREGKALWNAEASRFALRQVRFTPDGSRILAVDSRGVLFEYGIEGDLIGRLDFSSPTPAIRSLFDRGDATFALFEDGQIKRFDQATSKIAIGIGPFKVLVRFVVAGLCILAISGLVLVSRPVTQSVLRFAHGLIVGRTAYLLLLPTFTLLAIFNYIPVLTAFGYSFSKFSLTSPTEFVGLDNLRQMVSDPYVWVGFKNMLILLAAGLVKALTLPLLVAELVFWLPYARIRRVFRTLFVLPAVVPGIVAILIWKMIYDPYSGLINQTLQAVGLDEYTHAWLGEEQFALGAVIFYGFPWVGLLVFLVFLGGLIQIDRNVIEAAQIDGVSPWQRFLHIDLPYLEPKIKLVVTLVFIWSIQDFATVLILTGGGPGFATYIPALQMFKQIGEGANLGYASAIGLMLLAVVLVFTFLNMKLLRDDRSI